MRRVFIFILAVSLVGCAKLSHLDQLLTVKAYSDNKDLQRKYVGRQDKKFASLVAAVKDNSIREYTTRNEIEKRFDGPVVEQEVVKNGKKYQVCLYRYAAKFFGSEKVYFYYDEQGDLVKWEYQAG